MAYRFRLESMSATLRKLVNLKTLMLLTCMVAVASQHSTIAAGTKGDAARGQQVFQKNSCVMCHPGGENTMEPEHRIKGKAFQAKYSDDAVLESTIRKGFARDGMPSFPKSAINDGDMADLIAYVRSLSKTSTR
ncbi:MAG TPA: c-type cytochrome [Oculatellaceae cyanobacterium]